MLNSGNFYFWYQLDIRTGCIIWLKNIFGRKRQIQCLLSWNINIDNYEKAPIRWSSDVQLANHPPPRCHVTHTRTYTFTPTYSPSPVLISQPCFIIAFIYDCYEQYTILKSYSFVFKLDHSLLRKTIWQNKWKNNLCIYSTMDVASISEKLNPDKQTPNGSKLIDRSHK